jgi:hypothetical protein
MNDKSLIDTIARMWITCGGDSIGFNIVHHKIYDRIKELEYGTD